MPTAVSSSRAAALRRAVVDVAHLLRFRTRTVRRPRVTAAALAVFVVLTGAVAVVPAYVSSGPGSARAFDLLLLLPTLLAGFLVLAIVSAAASGGGRELIARDPASIHPVSPTTDHLGALLLAPVNIAWLLQAWALLGVTSYAVGPALLISSQTIVLVWLAAATALAQVLAWSLEGVRRVPHGIVGVRLLTVIVLGVTLGLQMSDRLLEVFDQIPTRVLVIGMVSDISWRWALTILVLLVVTLAAVALGAVPAHIAAHRIPRDELQQESGHHPVRRPPRTPLAGLIRTDRASVWRAVPMRRGLLVLALGPALVALLGDLQWQQMTILPGLVASGGALLYGVNAWCLDSRGALWRESLPVSPASVFAARAYVLGEFLLGASLLTVLVAAVRAGVPATSELTAIVCTVLVVTVQVVAAAMRWSAKRPYAVDLRSARATPAPPAMMVNYSSRLALSTTMTGVTFSLMARIDWHYSVLLAVPFLAWSTTRLLRTRRVWLEPESRARIVTAVAVA